MNKNIKELLSGVEVNWKRLGEVGEVRMCKRILKHQTSEKGDIPFYKIGTFGKNPNAYISRELFEEYKNKYNYPQKGEILISASGTIGRTVIFNGEDAYFQDSNIVWIENNENEVLNKFLFYLYQIINWNIAEGGTIKRLYNNNLKKLQIPIPNLKVQSEIVRILDNFTELTAEITAELTARKKQYSYYRDRLLSFKNNEVEWKRLGEVGEFKYGYSAKAQNFGDARFIRITDININGKLIYNNTKYIDIVEKNKKYILKKNDLLMARTGATYGKTMIFEENYPAIYAGFLIKIILCPKLINPKFYWHFAQSDFFWTQAKQLVSGGGQPQFNANVLKEIKIPIPPIEKQKEIVSILDKFDTLTNSISEGLPKEIELRTKQYEYYRDKLLNFKHQEKIEKLQKLKEHQDLEFLEIVLNDGMKIKEKQ